MKKTVIFFLFVLVQGVGIAQGSYISIETKTTATFQENTLVVQVSVTNKGDEPAHNVQVGIDANGMVAVTPVKDLLQINGTHNVETSFDMDIQTVGRYPLIVTVDYTDRNQYPFSAISSAYFVYKEDVSAKIHGTIDVVNISKSGKIVLSLKNLLDTAQKVRINLVVPRELSVSDAIQDVELASKSEKEIRFDVNNFSALTGSSYQIFAVMGYEDDNKHYTITIPGIVKIMEGKDFLMSYKWVFIGAGIALLVAFLGLQFGLPLLKKG